MVENKLDNIDNGKFHVGDYSPFSASFMKQTLENPKPYRAHASRWSSEF